MNIALLRPIVLPALLVLQVPGLHAQGVSSTPVFVFTNEELDVQHRYHQTSYTSVSQVGTRVGVTIWSTQPGAEAVFRIGGVDYPMSQRPGYNIQQGNFHSSVEFATRAAFDAATAPTAEILVKGTWRGGGQNLVPKLPAVRPAPPPIVVNFDEIQAWDGGALPLFLATSGAWHPQSTLRVVRVSNVAFSGDIQVLRVAVVHAGSNTVTGIAANPGETIYGEISPGVSYSPYSPPGMESTYEPPVTRDVLRFTIRRLAAPTIDVPPASRAVVAGTDATLTVAATGVGLAYQWRKDGAPLPGATAGTLVLRAVTAADAGSYTVAVANSGGTLVSSAAIVTVVAPVTPPLLVASPRAQTVLHGAASTLSITATGTDLRYQWFRDGTAIPGATTATLAFAATRLADAGAYTVTVSNSAGTITSTAGALEVAPVPRMANLSVRTRIGDGDNGAALTIGLTISGGTASAQKSILLRGAGPTLAAFGITDAASAIQLTLLRGPTLIATNDGWRGLPALAAAGGAVGAFAFSSPSSLDAAILPSIEPSGYTARIAAVGGAGVALAEIYDATPPEAFTIAVPRLTNLSALARVGTGGDILIAGFALAGSTPKTLLLRAVGPTLAAFGVGDALADPKLELFASGTATAISTNDNWGTAANAPQVAAAASSVGAFALALESKDAVLLATLPPGSYTAQVSGVNNTTGAALVEIYEVP